MLHATCLLAAFYCLLHRHTLRNTVMAPRSGANQRRCRYVKHHRRPRDRRFALRCASIPPPHGSPPITSGRNQWLDSSAQCQCLKYSCAIDPIVPGRQAAAPPCDGQQDKGAHPVLQSQPPSPRSQRAGRWRYHGTTSIGSGWVLSDHHPSSPSSPSCSWSFSRPAGIRRTPFSGNCHWPASSQGLGG